MKRASTGSRGVIGHRVITCVQTIDIGRLTADPVFLVPGGFIAVTGQGPIDSNQSSKTTFEAALSLVHGDPGWRQESPQFSGYAAELLFNPPNAPAGARVRAEVGFIVAVFADVPGGGSGSLLGGDPVTVWVRLRRHDDPAFEVTVTPGVHLACGDTHAARIDDAKRVWSTLRGPKWGPQRYARELFGSGVSCLSYVSTRGGRSEQRTTLLGSDISQLTPEQIAGQLVDLAGMRQLFDTEATQRVEFFRLSQQLNVKEQAVTKAAATVDGYEGEVEALDRRLELLDQATAARDRHVASTTLQILEDLAQLRGSHDTAARAVEGAGELVKKIEKQQSELNDTTVARAVAKAADVLAEAKGKRKPAADRAERLRIELGINERDLAVAQAAAAAWSGRPLPLVDADHARAKDAAERAATKAAIAARERDAAAEHLAAVRRGAAGPAGARLTKAGIAWRLLHDGVELADEARPFFEPLLHPFAGAICVPPGEESKALAAVSDLAGTVLVSGDGTLPADVLAAPSGAGGLLSWLAADGQQIDTAATLHRTITIVGGFDRPTVGRAAREAAADAAWKAADTKANDAQGRVGRTTELVKTLGEELVAAQAEQRRSELVAKRDELRRQAAATAEALAPLDMAVDDADAAHRDAQARQRDLRTRQGEVAAHLATCRNQLGELEKKLTETLTSADRLLLPAWVGHLDTCLPQPAEALAGAVGQHRPLDLPQELTGTLHARIEQVLTDRSDGISHRDILTRLEAGLGITVTVTASRNEQTRASVTGPDATLDAVTRMALVRYHEQAANVDRWRARGTEEREVSALDAAVAALRSAVQRQAQGMRSALERAKGEHNRLRREYNAAYDEVNATDAHLRNIQRSLEHQVRGLFTRVSQRFNDIRYRDGGNGGELDFQISPPSLEPPHRDQAAGRGWVLAATPRWARRPPDTGPPEHVAYHEQANTAQYKLATVQLVLAALLANEDPIGRLLILDELGDGLGDAHRERVLDALRRAADETGITVLATVQDDMQHEAFARCTEVLVLRYRSEADLLNEPTYMFVGDRRGDSDVALVPLIEALASRRGPGWSALLTVYDAAAATAAQQHALSHAG